VWDSVQLPEMARDRLLRMVVDGKPSNSPESCYATSAPSRERFGRLARACCAHDQKLREPFETLPGLVDMTPERAGHERPGGTGGNIVVFRIWLNGQEVRARPLTSSRDKEDWLHTALQNPSIGLHRIDAKQAYVSLAVPRQKVRVPKARRRHLHWASTRDIEDFWVYLRARLEPFRSLDRKFFHLYLGEACFRFNHRREVHARNRLKKLMQRLSKAEIDAVVSGVSTVGARANQTG
jgi:transposase